MTDQSLTQNLPIRDAKANGLAPKKKQLILNAFAMVSSTTPFILRISLGLCTMMDVLG